MSDDKLREEMPLGKTIDEIDKLLLRFQDPKQGLSLHWVRDEIIAKVREQDTFYERYKDVYAEAFEHGKQMGAGFERAKTIEACLAALDKRRIPDARTECSMCFNDGIAEARIAIKGVCDD